MYKTTETSKKSGTSRNFVYTRRRAGARVIALTTTNEAVRLQEADYIATELGTLAIAPLSRDLRIDYPFSASKTASTASSV